MAKEKAEAPAGTTVRIKLVKSPIGYNGRQRATLQALGLRRMQQVVEHTDSLVTRGMVNRVRHLVVVEGEVG